MEKTSFTLRKRSPKGSDVSAEWMVCELPGVILWKDSSPEQMCKDPIEWSWHFEMLDIPNPEEWPSVPDDVAYIHLTENLYFDHQRVALHLENYRRISRIILPLRRQNFSTRAEALQALEVAMLLEGEEQ